MKLDLGIMAGPESKKFLVDLTKLIDRMEAAATKLKGKKTTAKAAREETEEEENEEEEAEETESEEAEESEEEEAAEEESEEEETEEEEKPAKAKKLSADSVNDAAKALHSHYVKKKKLDSKKAFAKVKALLSEEFGVESVSKLGKADWAQAVKVLKGALK